ncbi:TonB-dependent receptor [Hallella colorans]|uniref:Outer membrane receptor protein involved in Fe transport n=1 Tax=Hallella colorans TaxID=1703337 RepID=A0A2U0ULY0_9BACT|nr:TonB-dependent receptor [Hallella colorans]PVX58657.1 outer membrane receptor protein involved in Fe transport [Hallella colorans]
MRYKLFLTLVSLLSLASVSLAQNILQGKIYDTKTKQPVSFASVYAIDIGKGVMADVQGKYVFRHAFSGDYRLRISCMGYATQEISVKAGTASLDVAMVEQSVTLRDFTVTAKYNSKIGSEATINQEALEYIQPTSLNDIFVLLPGGKMGSNNIQNNTLISSRQVGTDLATAFGMGVSINGVPIQNDGMRMQLSGLTGTSMADPNGNVTANTGIDLRTISTDHIERITVTRGISSAKEGNLSSGAIKIDLKQGKSPLRIRAKFDPLNKLAYAGKGFLLSEQLGTLYIGADIVQSAADIADTRGAYNRVTTQLNYNNKRQWWGKAVDLNMRGSWVTSFNNNKTDALIKAYQEKYNTLYQRLDFSAKLKMALELPWIDYLELVTSADYTNNKLEHHKHVVNHSVTPMPQSYGEGEHDGIFLPSTYDTYYEIINRPINTFAQLCGQKFGQWSKHLNYNLLLGSSLNYTKNLGDGTIMNPQRPPFPTSSFIRPRKNSDIPALVNQAAFAEMTLRFHARRNEVNMRIGVREAMMLNLPQHYDLHGKPLLEPRIQLAYTITGSHHMQNTFRIGYGVENKLPSADYLYPDKVYHDLMVMNAYFNDESKRRLILDTHIADPSNPHLHENKNKKWEIGYDFSCHGWKINLSAFHEEMNDGIEYFTQYEPVTYTYYYQLKHPVSTKPSRKDFLSRTMHSFVSNRMPKNSAKVIKKGLEYRIHIPTLTAIKSDIEVNGAYYHTIYTDGIPVMYWPGTIQNDKPYPYVGLYDGFEKKYASSLNTNMWINTRLPQWKLIFTNFIQTVWFTKSRLGKDVDIYPANYLDCDGVIHRFRYEELERNPILQSLKREFTGARYNENKAPVSLLWNIKLTKEMGRSFKLSFFANNIIQINPKYVNAYYQTTRSWHKPFFGAELTVNVF